MKKIAFSVIPFLFFGFMFNDERCGNGTVPNGTGEQLDGPYVSYKGDYILVQYIVDRAGVKGFAQDSLAASSRSGISLNVMTDEPGKMFTVTLQQKLEKQPNEFPTATKQFIVSDIEGNFGAFRKLLQANGVIDSSYNWTFGDGHLVLTGDFVDRGAQQNEVLWLIYALEDKAKAAGGYVHFVLGNHEIMNMNGDLRYLHAKYFEAAKILNTPFVTLYGEQSEIGRWLRTKNVVERVGDVLFCHAGISAAVNRMDISIPDINKTVQPYYGDSSYTYKTVEADTLYSDLGPFWYRGYYTGIKATSAQIDSTLGRYNVSHIATGHTVIADTISSLYNGRVFNTDVHHAKGKTEAILFENGQYFRVTPGGGKHLLTITR